MPHFHLQIQSHIINHFSQQVQLFQTFPHPKYQVSHNPKTSQLTCKTIKQQLKTSLQNINNRIQSDNNLKQNVSNKQKKQYMMYILSSWHINIKSSYYVIDDYIKLLNNKNRKYRRIVVNKMENQLNCSNIVLKSVKDVAELKQKLGKRVPFEMEQISQMFNQDQNSSFNFDVLNARKNFSAKNQDINDKINIKQAFFRRYAEINVGRDRVVEDCGFDMMMLGNKAKSLNIKNPVITQSANQFIPRNRFIALNKIMRLKSPKKLEPLNTLNNLKVNTSLVFKNENRLEERSQEIQISIRKRRLLPLLSDQGRTSAFSRSQRTEVSPQISPKPSSSMQQTPNFRPTPSISPTTQKRVLKKEPIKPIKKQTMNTLKQLLKNRRKQEENKRMQKRGRNTMTEGNEDSGHKKNYTPLEPWKIQMDGADFQFIA